VIYLVVRDSEGSYWRQIARSINVVPSVIDPPSLIDGRNFLRDFPNGVVHGEQKELIYLAGGPATSKC
jgi:hypothetical protein